MGNINNAKYVNENTWKLYAYKNENNFTITSEKFSIVLANFENNIKVYNENCIN